MRRQNNASGRVSLTSIIGISAVILMIGTVLYSTSAARRLEPQPTQEADPRFVLDHIFKKDKCPECPECHEKTCPRVQVPVPEQITQRRPNKMILLWNWIVIDGWERLKDFKNCPISECTIVEYDQSRIEEADAVVLYVAHSWNYTIKPKTRRMDQKWIMYTIESPLLPFGEDPFQGMKFNLTMTYRLNSDIPYIYPLHVPLKPPPVPNKFGLVFWMAAHCNAKNNRIDYIKELLNHVQVDCFGWCLHNRDEFTIINEKGENQTIKPLGRMQYLDGGNDILYKSYKFYLAFENFNCLDYVTEKFWWPLQHGAVPVVFGAPNIDDFAPYPGSIIKASDFKTPKDLADYLLFLDKNDDEYMKYHQWRTMELHQLNKKYQDMYRLNSACTLCAKVHEEAPYSSYNDEEVFNIHSQCKYEPENKPSANAKV